jgi:ribosomal protein S11
MSRTQWAVIAILGVAVTCVFFWFGSYLVMYLTETLPSLSSAAPTPTEAPTAIPLPTATEAASPTPSPTSLPPSPSATATPEPPPPTNTRVIPLSTPLLPPTITPREPVAPDGWEPDDSRADARPIGLGESQAHNLHVEGDRDWLFFEAEEGRAYVIETSNLGGEVDTVVELYDEEGNELASDDDGGDEFLASRLWWVATEGGSTYVQIRSFSDHEEGPGTTYDVSVSVAEGFQIDQYEPDGTRARATLIEAGERQTHNRHVAGDRDWLYIEAQVGVTYVIQTSNLGPHADTVVYLYDAAGNELAWDDDGGEQLWASRLEWTAPQDGTLYVLVEDWFEASAGPGTRYDIAVQGG